MTIPVQQLQWHSAAVFWGMQPQETEDMRRRRRTAPASRAAAETTDLERSAASRIWRRGARPSRPITTNFCVLDRVMRDGTLHDLNDHHALPDNVLRLRLPSRWLSQAQRRRQGWRNREKVSVVARSLVAFADTTVGRRNRRRTRRRLFLPTRIAYKHWSGRSRKMKRRPRRHLAAGVALPPLLAAAVVTGRPRRRRDLRKPRRGGCVLHTTLLHADI